MPSMEEVVLNFTTTTDVLALNGHYLGVVEAHNDVGGSNGSEIHFSKLYICFILVTCTSRSKNEMFGVINI